MENTKRLSFNNETNDINETNKINEINNDITDFSDIDINNINVNSFENITSRNNSPIKIEEDEEFFNNLDDINFEPKVKIKILGIGGAGNNMIEHIAKNSTLDQKSLYAVNTDFQVLKKMENNCNKLLIGKNITRGYGSGSDPVIGEKSANEDRDTIKKILKDVDLLFILSGMGKGTGTGASPIIAEIANEMKILTIAVVNIPSISTEGKNIYEKGISGSNNLRKFVNGIATINNDKILSANNESDSLYNSFKKVNQVICDIINDLINTVTIPSQINIDFNDIKNFFKEKTNFQITNCDIEDGNNTIETIKNKISSTLFEEKLLGSKKAILTLKLNPDVPRSFISDVRSVMEEITGNQDLELMYSTEYSEDIKYAKISILVATNSFDFNVVEEILLPPEIPMIKISNPTVNLNENNVNKSLIENDRPSIQLNIDNTDIEKDEYHLDEIQIHNNNFNSLQKEIAESRHTSEKLFITKNLDQKYPTQNTSFNSTNLNKFVNRTLSLFKGNNTNEFNNKN